MRFSPKRSSKPKVRVNSRSSQTAQQENPFETLGGVYVTSSQLQEGISSISGELHRIGEVGEESPHSGSSSSLVERDQKKGDGLWISSGSADHHADSPAFRRRSGLMSPDDNGGVTLGDEEVFGRVMMRSRMHLPSSRGGLASFHVLINEDRTKKGIAPLARNRALDDFAREKAQSMAKLGQLCHADPMEIQTAFGRESIRIGSNVAKGSNVSAIFEAMKDSLSDINNVRDRRFTLVGVGTSKGEDGKLYVCQVFRG